jgi:uncharacterized delta-60 repeat protein
MPARIGRLAAATGGFVATLSVGALIASGSAGAAPGDLDPSFGQGGHARVQTNAACLTVCVEFGGSYADAVAVQPDGAIALGGFNEYIGAFGPIAAEAPRGALMRLLPTGALDASFGKGGIENTTLAVQQIASDRAGGLSVVGSAEGATGLSRYTANGTLDGSFVPGGVRWLAEPTGASEVQLDARGRIVAIVAVSTVQIDVVRFLGDGALDTSFGHGGYVRLHLPESPREAKLPPRLAIPPVAVPLALANEPDGSVLVAFSVAESLAEGYAQPRYFLERYASNGRLDRKFGTGGLVQMRHGAAAMAVAPDGRIVLASGERGAGSYALGGRSPEHGELVLASYDAAGQPDRSFGRDGVVRSPPLAGKLVGVAPRAIAFDTAGNAIVVGELPEQTVDTPMGTGFLARFTPRGPDCSFGDGGVVVDDAIGGASAVAVQPDGRIVIAGWAGKAFVAARYLGGGTPRTCGREPNA